MGQFIIGSYSRFGISFRFLRNCLVCDGSIHFVFVTAGHNKCFNASIILFCVDAQGTAPGGKHAFIVFLGEGRPENSNFYSF